MHIRAVVLNNSDYFAIKKVGDGQYEGFAGMEYQLWKILSAMLHFTYELIPPDDGKRGGSRMPDTEQWDGAFGMLQRNCADAVIGLLAENSERMDVADFSFPLDIHRLVFVVKKAGPASKDFVYFYPFNLKVWICFFVSLLLCSILFAVFFPSHQPPNINWKSLVKNAVTYIESILAFQGSNGLRRSISARIFLASHGISIKLLALFFNAIFLSFLMAPIMENQIETFAQLAAASKTHKIKIFAPRTSFMLSLASTTGSPTLKGLTEKLHIHPETFFDPQASFAPIVMNGSAVLYLDSFTKLNIYKTGHSEKVFISKENLRIVHTAIAFRKTFCCLQEFNKMIRNLQESGIYKKVVDDYLFEQLWKGSQVMASEEVEHRRPIKLDDIKGVFWLAISFCTIAIFFLMLEVCSRRASIQNVLSMA